MFIKQRLLRGGAPRAMDAMLVCCADGNGDGNGDGGGDDKEKAFAALTTKNAELLDELKKTRAKVRDAETAEADRQKAIADAEEEKARKAKDFETIENGYKGKLSKAEGDALLYRSKYETLIIDRGLDEALDGAKINPALKKAALALLKAEHGVDLSEDGKPTISGKALSDFVNDWAKTDTGKAFVVNGNGGGGAPGSGGDKGGGGGDVNPWKPGSINLTLQGQMLKADRAKAVQMAAQHGVKL